MIRQKKGAFQFNFASYIRQFWGDTELSAVAFSDHFSVILIPPRYQNIITIMEEYAKAEASDKKMEQ